MVTVGDVVRLALPPGTRVLAGEARVGDEVGWARHIRARGLSLASLGRGELLLISLERGTSPIDERSLALLARDLAAAGACALVCLGSVPERVVAAAVEHGLTLLESPAGADPEELERRALALVVDREAGLRQRVEEVHERLVESLVEDRGPRPLLEALATASGKGVLLLDEYLQPADSVGLATERVEPLAAEVREHLSGRWDRAARGRTPRAFPLTSTGEGQRGLAAPLVLKGTPVGALCLVGAATGFADYDERIAARAATVLVLEVAEQRAVEAARLRLQGDFLADLLAGDFRSDDAIHNRARWIGHDLGRPYRVVALGQDAQPAAAANEASSRPRAGDAGWISTAAGRRNALVVARGGHLVVVLPLEDADDDARAVAAAEELRIEAAAGLDGGARLSAGIGRYHPGLRGFAPMCREAERALTAAQVLLGGDCTVAYRDLGANRLLVELLGSPELAAFYADHLGNLAAYDQRHNAGLLTTLEVFFAANNNHVRAAKLLHLHRNTLLYRLDRIRQVLGVDLDDPETRLALYLALKLKHVARGALHVADDTGPRDTREPARQRSIS